MSQEAFATSSASRSEKDARPPIPAPPARASKSRSCIVCRQRKVRCDKQSPCSNCRRANISCILPSTDRPPRWARRLEHLANKAASSDASTPANAEPPTERLMERLQNLESLVKELRGQLQQARATSGSVADGSSGVNSPANSPQARDTEQHSHHSPATDTSNVHGQFGRLVIQDANRSRYVSSGFWSRIDDELDGLKRDTHHLAGGDDSSEDEASLAQTTSSQGHERTPWDTNAFLFRHNLSGPAPDLHEFHPLPSQIPFLLDVFLENVNFFFRIVHVPTITRMARDLRGEGRKSLSPSNEALMFSIYYAAVTSMEEEDVTTNFGSSKADLAYRYRIGFEHALAKADFLNNPDITLIQALGLTLSLSRQHDNARFVWMMTGLLVRMAQYLGLQRDGTHFEHLTPFDIYTRRNLWLAVSWLDIVAAEDQGTDLLIKNGSFDTQMPTNINDEDIRPDSKEMPKERVGITDMSFGRLTARMNNVQRQIIGQGDTALSLEDKDRVVNEIYQQFDEEYLQHVTDSSNILYWIAMTAARIVIAKLKLIASLPILFSSPNEHASNKLKTKLLGTAIELAEYNHALNAEPAGKQWRWLWKNHTHWHATVFLLIEISRRTWSPISERAWVALHSTWLIPERALTDNKSGLWVPLRKLIEKARRHRNAEIQRLRSDPQAAAKAEVEDQDIPLSSSSAAIANGAAVDFFRQRWRQLITMSGTLDEGVQRYSGLNTSQLVPTDQARATGADINTTSNQTDLDSSQKQLDESPLNYATDHATAYALGPTNDSTVVYPNNISYNAYSTLWPNPDGRNTGPGFQWQWADINPAVGAFAGAGMDLDLVDASLEVGGEMDWYNWVEAAKGVQWS